MSSIIRAAKSLLILASAAAVFVVTVHAQSGVLESGIVLAGLTVLLVVLGVYPAALIHVLHGALAGFGPP